MTPDEARAVIAEFFHYEQIPPREQFDQVLRALATLGLLDYVGRDSGGKEFYRGNREALLNGAWDREWHGPAWMARLATYRSSRGGAGRNEAPDRRRPNGRRRQPHRP